MLLTVSASSTSLINIPIRYLSFLWQLPMFILMNIYWSEKNLLISSKSIKPESLDDILGDILKKDTTITSFLNMPTLSLSRTESSMLRMWMAGQGTIQISDQMNIKAKTVSSHKGNIKRKIKTHNKQVIYHVVRLTDNVTNGIFVNMR